MTRWPSRYMALIWAFVCSSLGWAQSMGTEGYADSSGVKIHYVTLGEGPVVLFIHGFPDYWYTWRKQMPALAEHFQVVAIDQRGFNLSDQPEGVENYTVDKLVGDVAAVLDHLGVEKATIVGHDWGGFVAWSFAMTKPERTERLIILNLPHPACLMRELQNNPEQQKNSQYARNFQKPEAAKMLRPEILAMWVKDKEARPHYVEAFKRSSLEGMLNYYKANYPREPYESAPDLPKVDCSVLMIHGLKDTALLPGGLNDTWNYVNKDFTLVTLPNASHFVQQDEPEMVTKTMLGWLRRSEPAAPK